MQSRIIYNCKIELENSSKYYRNVKDWILWNIIDLQNVAKYDRIAKIYRIKELNIIELENREEFWCYRMNKKAKDYRAAK